MADDLSNYKLQLQQVEVALLTDPDNAELLKLKDDIGKLNFKSLKQIRSTVLFRFRSTDNASEGADKNYGSRTAKIHRAIEFRRC